MRIGSTNRRADQPLVQEMQRMARNETYDESPLAHLDSEALDFRVAAELFPRHSKLDRAALQTLRALARIERKLVPTVGGLLLFGKDPEREFPDAWIQCGRFGGTDKSVLADTVECHGTGEMGPGRCSLFTVCQPAASEPGGDAEWQTRCEPIRSSRAMAPEDGTER